MNKALILVDLQNEWVDPASDYFVGDLSGLVEKTNRLLDHCRQAGYKIIFTRHVEETGETAFAPESENSEIMPEINRLAGDTVITKHRISPFYRTRLEDELTGIGHIIVAGLLANLCVRSLVQDAYDRDLEITVIKDCSPAMSKETGEFTWKDLKETREEIEFIDLDKFIKK